MPTNHHLDSRAAELAAAGLVGVADMLSTAALAAWLDVSTQFLEIGRSRGYGPLFIKLSPRCVRYRRADVIAWLRDRSRAAGKPSGSQSGAAGGRPLLPAPMLPGGPENPVYDSFNIGGADEAAR
ncbi:MAG TPA: hypothetical protein VH020_13965 [Stellaceae bacterium]|jgi:hypothetical protein|nr:hypothetical protein [Stellaceae bacterium]